MTDHRLHIGHISPQLAASVSELESRLAKYGQITEPLVLHSKPIDDHQFGYVTLRCSDQQLKDVLGAFKGVKFKGSALQISEAKPSYLQRLHAEQAKPDRPKLNRDQLKRKFTKHQPQGVILARQRVKPRSRKEILASSIRLLKTGKNGRPKLTIVRCRKTKLWGYAKNKTIDDLVYEYRDGQWKDGQGGTLETMDWTQAMEESGHEEEQTKYLDVLDSLGIGESTTRVTDDDEQEKEYEDGREEHEEEEMEEMEESENEEDEEMEAEEKEESKNAHKKDQDPIKNTTTEALRNLFSDQGLFQLGENDIRETPESIAPVFELPVVEDVTPRPRSRRGLFFLHHDSPYLSAMSHVSKTFRHTIDTDQWQDQFWAHRGGWNRELKRRRREVVRTLKKKPRARQ